MDKSHIFIVRISAARQPGHACHATVRAIEAAEATVVRTADELATSMLAVLQRTSSPPQPLAEASGIRESSWLGAVAGSPAGSSRRDFPKFADGRRCGVQPLRRFSHRVGRRVCARPSPPPSGIGRTAVWPATWPVFRCPLLVRRYVRLGKQGCRKSIPVRSDPGIQGESTCSFHQR